jgi:hypothetical protein
MGATVLCHRSQSLSSARSRRRSVRSRPTNGRTSPPDWETSTSTAGTARRSGTLGPIDSATVGRCPRPLGVRSGREDHQGDNALRLLRDVRQLRIALGCLREEAVALVADGLLRYYVNRLATDFDPRDRVLL